jgi:hypothetical protein
LFDLIRQNAREIARPDSYRLSLSDLSGVDAGKLPLVPLLFQAGYLTVGEQISASEFIVRVPNGEAAETIGHALFAGHGRQDGTAGNVDGLKEDIGQATRDAALARLARSF